MNRGIALLVVVIALVGVAGVVAAGPVGTAVAQDDPVAANETSEGNETEAANGTDISPGEQFSGVIGVQRAEVTGEVESRAFEVGLNRTETPEARADLVVEQLNRSEERLAEVERRQRELRERRDAGELTPGAFAARMAETSARAETVEREANRSAEVASGLPESVRADRGLSEERLGQLRERAGNASGPEVAAIARGVAGTGVGGPLASDRRGPPGDMGDGPGAGDGPEAGDGPSERGNGTDDDATNGTDEATNAVGTSDDAGNDTSDRGADDGGNETSPGDGSSAAGGDDRGNGTAAGNVAGSTADSLVEPLTEGADVVRRVLGGIHG
ncbi:MAG: hypothetical protein R6U01_06360 [Halorubrum sp.]|uniref:DUF7096 domain-containing protein n=1 Tax=Halorubrum sp. TaxID=1879286 RepID=UPI003970A054